MAEGSVEKQLLLPKASVRRIMKLSDEVVNVSAVSGKAYFLLEMLEVGHNRVHIAIQHYSEF
jgi:histone H3/H4